MDVEYKNKVVRKKSVNNLIVKDLAVIKSVNFHHHPTPPLKNPTDAASHAARGWSSIECNGFHICCAAQKQEQGLPAAKQCPATELVWYEARIQARGYTYGAGRSSVVHLVFVQSVAL